MNCDAIWSLESPPDSSGYLIIITKKKNKPKPIYLVLVSASLVYRYSFSTSLNGRPKKNLKKATYLFYTNLFKLINRLVHTIYVRS